MTTGQTEQTSVTEVLVNKVPVELYKILKFEGLAASGAEAKAAVAEGMVRVNGAVETQKRKKIVAGDTVQFADQTLHIVFAGNAES